MSTAKYNIAKYNSPTARIKYIYLDFSAHSEIIAVVGARTYMPLLFRANSRVNSKVNMRILLPLEFVSADRLTSKVTPILFIHMHLITKDYVSSLVSIFAYIDSTLIFSSKLMPKIHVGMLMHIETLNMSSDIDSSVTIGQLIPLNFHSVDVVYAFVSMGMKRQASFTINTIIPPGGEIRIDSENFSVIRGTEDIFWTFSGEWIMLNRNTRQLVLSAQAGTLIEGELVYDARFI